MLTRLARLSAQIRPLALLAAIAFGTPTFWAVGSPASPDQPDRAPTRAGQVDLRPRFTPGQVTRYEMVSNSRSQLSSKEVPELDQKQAMKQTLRLSLKVIEAGSDGATIELSYDAAKVTFENGEFTAEYDSTRPPAASTPAKPADPLDMADPSKLLETLVKGMVGSKLTFKTDAAGNITSVTGDGGVSDMSKSLIAAVGGGLAGAGGGGVSGKDAAKWIINGPRPSGFASVGESWTNDDSLGGTPLGEFKMKTTHTLVSHRGHNASLKFTGRAEAASAGTPSPSGFQLRHMTSDGTYQWDTERGGLEKMDADMRVAIEATLTGVAMQHESTTTVSVKRLDR